jgi:hypothetical protein
MTAETLLMKMWRLIRFSLWYWCGKQHGAIERLPQVQSRRNVAPQIGDNHLLIHNFAVQPNPGSVGRQGDVDNSIREAKCGRNFIKNEWSVRDVADGNYNPFLGARVGIVCHDGSSRFWEWDNKRNCFVALLLPSPWIA